MHRVGRVRVRAHQSAPGGHQPQRHGVAPGDGLAGQLHMLRVPGDLELARAAHRARSEARRGVQPEAVPEGGAGARLALQPARLLRVHWEF